MGDAPRVQRSSIGQMRQCLHALSARGACMNLHRSKVIYSRSEAELLEKQLKDAAEFLAALEPHKEEIRALLSGRAA